MKILVNGDIKHLTAIDFNGNEFTNDLLGNHDALKYNDTDEEAVMTESDYLYWVSAIADLNKLETVKGILFDAGYSEEFEQAMNDAGSSCDLTDETTAHLAAAEELAKSFELI